MDLFTLPEFRPPVYVSTLLLIPFFFPLNFCRLMGSVVKFNLRSLLCSPKNLPRVPFSTQGSAWGVFLCCVRVFGPYSPFPFAFLFEQPPYDLLRLKPILPVEGLFLLFSPFSDHTSLSPFLLFSLTDPELSAGRFIFPWSFFRHSPLPLPPLSCGPVFPPFPSFFFFFPSFLPETTVRCFLAALWFFL